MINMSNEQTLFQQKPKETAACTLVKDTVDSKKIRDFVKEHITEKLSSKADDYEVEENDFQWSVTQRYVSKPAMINLRLKSYRKGMKLVAFNSFEVYHGDCKITFMRLRNDLSDDKLKEHVDDAIKAFKEQVKFGEKEATDYKKEHKKQLKLEQKVNARLEKEFEGMVFERNDEGLVKVFDRYAYNYEGRQGSFVQLLDVAKCNKFDFAPKVIPLPQESTDVLPKTLKNKSYVYMTADYDMKNGMWFYDIMNLPLDVMVDMFNLNKSGTKITTPPTDNNKKRVDLYRPRFAIGTNSARRYCDRYYRANQEVRDIATFSHVSNTPDFIALIKQLKLRVWKISKD